MRRYFPLHADHVSRIAPAKIEISQHAETATAIATSMFVLPDLRGAAGKFVRGSQPALETRCREQPAAIRFFSAESAVRNRNGLPRPGIDPLDRGYGASPAAVAASGGLGGCLRAGFG